MTLGLPICESYSFSMPGTSGCVGRPFPSGSGRPKRRVGGAGFSAAGPRGMEHSSRSPQICRHPQDLQAAAEGFLAECL